MTPLCTESDLLTLEPAIVAAAALADFHAMEKAAGTLAGTTLTLNSGSFTTAGVAPGMVAIVRLADDSAGANCEIVSAAAGTATVSLIRPRDGDAVPPAVSGAVTVTVLNLRAMIEGVGDELVALLKGVCDRDVDPATITWSGPVRSAAAMGVLARLMRITAATTHLINVLPAKQKAYEDAYAALRRSLVAHIDLDGDGRADRTVYTGSVELERA